MWNGTKKGVGIGSGVPFHSLHFKIEPAMGMSIRSGSHPSFKVKPTGGIGSGIPSSCEMSVLKIRSNTTNTLVGLLFILNERGVPVPMPPSLVLFRMKGVLHDPMPVPVRRSMPVYQILSLKFRV